MKAEYLNPFVVAATETWKTQLGIELEKGDLSLAKDRKTGRDITAVIGFAGKVKGNVVLAVDTEAARKFIGKMLGQEIVSDDDVYDGMRELCNMVGGSAKAELNKLGLNLEVALPNVMIGKDIEVAVARGGITLMVPFHSEAGDFDLRVSMK